MQAAGVPPPDTIEADGKLHRFSTNGKGGDYSGWYVMYPGRVAGGVFGCWRTGFTQAWCSKSDNAMTAAERQVHRQRIKTMQVQREADEAQRQHEASLAATALWKQANPAAHPYLVRKGIQTHGSKVDGSGTLLVPMRCPDSKLWNLERISPHEGTAKKGLPGGRRKGCYHSIGRPQGVLVVAEGFATGASIHECTGHAVAVAFNAGNLFEVALALRSKYPNLKIIIAADDDHQTAGNPGIAKATEAARAVGASLAIPVFDETRPDNATDFNDLHHLAGAAVVRQCFESARENLVDSACETFTDVQLDAWSEPIPLPDGLPSVQAFDLALLPEALRAWVADIAERMQCPPDFTAVGAVVALSSLIGARAVVKPKARDDWAVVPNLWGAIIGRPGVMKSPALTEVLKPLSQLEKAERELWETAHVAWDLDCKVAGLANVTNERQAKGLAAKDPAAARELLRPTHAPPEPTMRRYLVNDATVEKLADLLVTNAWGTLVYRDEMHGLLCSMDKQGQEGARGFYLTGYDGNQGHAVDRIGRGESYVPRVCLAMLGGIQPGKVQSYVREAVAGGAGDDGLLQRFGLTVWPDINREFVYVDRWPDTPARQAAWDVFERLTQLQPASDDAAAEWRFSPEAQTIFEEWMVPFENEIRGEELHPALVSHLSKYRKLIPALALIFALVDTPNSGGVIHKNELLRALAWGEYLRSHAERLYAAAMMPETAGAATLLTKIRTGKLVDVCGLVLDSFTPRQVAVKHWTGLNVVDAVRKAADLLVDYGWLCKEVVVVTGRRNSERYLVHPDLLTGSLK